MRTRPAREDDASPPSVPRYAAVANDLIARIAAGRYPVGTLLPKEVDLSAEYGISRHTIREALRRLDEAGLVSRRKRAGTAVVASAPVTSYRQPINSIADILQYGAETRLRVRAQARVASDARLAAMLGCEEGREWIRIETIRAQPGDTRPICLTTMYVNTALEDIDARLRTLTQPVSAMIEATYGIEIAVIEQSIEAIEVDRRAARLLRVTPGSAALRAVRRFYDRDGRLLELSIAVHPGERFAYVTRLQRA